MRKAVKKIGKTVRAYELGRDDKKLDKFIREGKIKKISGTQYEIFSQEARSERGETAYTGDYVKIDSSNSPYPNRKEKFLKNHRFIRENEYEQISHPVSIWQADEPMNDEIRFLIENKGLVIDESEEKKYFTAPLWGTVLNAEKNAYLLCYDVRKNPEGEITDIDFCFVEHQEFELTYRILDK